MATKLKYEENKKDYLRKKAKHLEATITIDKHTQTLEKYCNFIWMQ